MKIFNSSFKQTLKEATNSCSSPSNQVLKEKEKEIITTALIIISCGFGVFALNYYSTYSLALLNGVYTILHFVSAKLLYNRYRKLYSLVFNLIAISYPSMLLRIENGLFPAYFAVFSLSIFSLIFSNVIYGTIILLYGIYLLKTTITVEFNRICSNQSQEETDKFINLTILYAVAQYLTVYCYSRSSQKYQDRYVESKNIEYAFNQQNNFLLTLSHELRNPLNSLLGNIELSLFEKIPVEVRDLLTNAQVCGELLLHLINNILDSGKAAIENLEVNIVDCSIYQVCEKIWAISSGLISQKGLKGSLSISKNVPRILKADPYRVTQILLNLVGNAIKFTDHGQIKINVDWLPRETTVTDQSFMPTPYDDIEDEEGIHEKNEAIFSYLGNGDYEILTSKNKKFKDLGPMPITNSVPGILRIAIIDTGCGLDQADKEKLFQKFSQVNSCSSKKQIGAGLGLYISQELIKNMNGQIKVFSKLGKGSSFILCIPTCSSAYRPSPSVQDLSEVIDRWPLNDIPLNPARVSHERKRVLVVDDSKWNIAVLTHYLNRIHLAHSCAFTGLEAYNKFEKAHKEGKPFAAITMDYDMPIMNGKEALIKIRKYERENKLKPCLGIVISGHCDKTIINELLNPHGEARADFYLKKPVTFEQISELLGKLTT